MDMFVCFSNNDVSKCNPHFCLYPSSRSQNLSKNLPFHPSHFPFSIPSSSCSSIFPIFVRAQSPNSTHHSCSSKKSMDFEEIIVPPTSSSYSSSSSSIDFLTLCHRLKTTKRKGWINNGIKNAESVADHMYRMSLMALIFDDLPGLNRERCIKMAIVHDIAEAIVGDITPSDAVPKEEKNRMESAALEEMCRVLGGGARAEEIKDLWIEYETNASFEAAVVKDLDKVEMILQALEYELEHEIVLEEFFLSISGKLQTDVGKRWAAEIVSRRKTK